MELYVTGDFGNWRYQASREANYMAMARIGIRTAKPGTLDQVVIGWA